MERRPERTDGGHTRHADAASTGPVVIVSEHEAETEALDDRAEKPPEFAAVVRAADSRRVGRREDADESSDTEADEDAMPKGAGWKGRGPPLQVGRWSRKRPLCDGAGLCSTGIWAPRERPKAHSAALQSFAAAVHRSVVMQDSKRDWSGELYQWLCEGEVQDDPFPRSVTQELKEFARSLFQDGL